MGSACSAPSKRTEDETKTPPGYLAKEVDEEEPSCNSQIQRQESGELLSTSNSPTNKRRFVSILENQGHNAPAGGAMNSIPCDRPQQTSRDREANPEERRASSTSLRNNMRPPLRLMRAGSIPQQSPSSSSCCSSLSPRNNNALHATLPLVPDPNMLTLSRPSRGCVSSNSRTSSPSPHIPHHAVQGQSGNRKSTPDIFGPRYASPSGSPSCTSFGTELQSLAEHVPVTHIGNVALHHHHPSYRSYASHQGIIATSSSSKVAIDRGSNVVESLVTSGASSPLVPHNTSVTELDDANEHLENSGSPEVSVTAAQFSRTKTLVPRRSMLTAKHDNTEEEVLNSTVSSCCHSPRASAVDSGGAQLGTLIATSSPEAKSTTELVDDDSSTHDAEAASTTSHHNESPNHNNHFGPHDVNSNLTSMDNSRRTSFASCFKHIPQLKGHAFGAIVEEADSGGGYHPLPFPYPSTNSEKNTVPMISSSVGASLSPELHRQRHSSQQAQASATSPRFSSMSERSLSSCLIPLQE